MDNFKIYSVLLFFYKTNGFNQLLENMNYYFKLSTNNFLETLLRNNKVSFRFLKYFKENEMSNNFMLDINKIKNFIKKTENFNNNDSELIILYFLSMYLKLDEIYEYSKQYDYLKTNFTKIKTIYAYIYNYKLCYEFPEEDEELIITNNYCMKYSIYEKMNEYFDIIENFLDNYEDLLFFNKIRKELEI